jgi:hypothetical protein
MYHLMSSLNRTLPSVHYYELSSLVQVRQLGTDTNYADIFTTAAMDIILTCCYFKK